MAVLLARHLRYDWEHPDDPANDHLIFSKGHASPLLYAMFRPPADQRRGADHHYRRFGSRLQGHPTPALPWVDVATGSLGQGIPYGVGIALAGRYLDQLPYRVWVLCGDSEMAEGSVWEALDKAAHYGLDNLTAIVDVNRLGQSGPTEFGWDMDAYAARVEAFGCTRPVIDGHDLAEIDEALAAAPAGRPDRDLARTVKGRGFAEIEDREGWHGKPLPPDMAAAGDRRARRRSATCGRGPACPSTPAPASVRASGAGHACPATSLAAKVATRKAFGDALAALGARPDVVALDGEVGQLDLRRVVRQGVPGPVLRDVHRRAADDRGRGRAGGARLRAVRLHLRRVPHAAPTTSCGWPPSPGRSSCAARTPASRSAPTARPRWAWRTSR